MLTFAGTYVMKLTLRWGRGWGWVGHVNVAATYVMMLMLRWGWGWGWWHLRHEVDATLGMGVGLRMSGAKRHKLLAHEAIHQDKVYAKTLRSVPKHLSSVAGTQCIDRHWRSVKEFIGATFPKRLKVCLEQKFTQEFPTLCASGCTDLGIALKLLLVYTKT